MKNQITITPAINAQAKAVQRAKNYFGKSFIGCEVWEKSSEQITIRAYSADDDGFFTEEI